MLAIEVFICTIGNINDLLSVIAAFASFINFKLNSHEQRMTLSTVEDRRGFVVVIFDCAAVEFVVAGLAIWLVVVV